MQIWLWVPILILLALILLIIAWRPMHRLGGAIQGERASELFMLQREKLEEAFSHVAGATGKPRGLRWKACTFEKGVEFARDRKTRQLVALVQVTIEFEAIEGSDMEGLPAVGNLRNASAVFFFQSGQWSTSGKTVFNMNPGEALHHLRNQYETLATTTPDGAQAMRTPSKDGVKQES